MIRAPHQEKPFLGAERSEQRLLERLARRAARASWNARLVPGPRHGCRAQASGPILTVTR